MSDAQLPPLDHRQRYTVAEAAKLLRISRAKLFLDIKSGAIRTLQDGRRRFVPGSEIVRKSTLPMSSAPAKAARTNAPS